MPQEESAKVNQIYIPHTPDTSALPSERRWKGYEKIILRITFIYGAILSVPLDKTWYDYLADIEWLRLSCRDLFVLATFRSPEFIKIATESGQWGIASYVNMAVSLGIAVVAGFIWAYIDRKREYNDRLYYWMRVLLRYRVGLGVIAWGLRKLLPGQMVLPTTGILNTPFLDMQAQKLYWQSVGIAPGYEMFLGAAEFTAGFLLLFRKSTAPGAALAAVVMTNIVITNHSYDGAVHLHCACYASLALIILWKDLPNIWNLLVNEKNVRPFNWYPSFSKSWQKITRAGIKIMMHGVFVVLFFILQLDDYIHRPYRLPDTPGLSGAEGVYEVTEFRWNNKVIPYSPLDPQRWQDAIFESWSTISFKVNRKTIVDPTNGGRYSENDLGRNWELSGVGGGRRFFYYEADTIRKELRLINKSDRNRSERFLFHYSRPSSSRIILSGRTERNDSVYVVLDRIDKTYPLLKGRKKILEAEP